MSFVHLHNHSMYSIHDALPKIKPLVAKFKDLGMNAAAITDHGVMYGVIDFYHACKDAGIKPILGCEVYVAPRDGREKDPNHRYNHLVLLAETNEGYYNLQQIVTEGCVGDMFYYKPRVDDSVLRKYSKGIIALSACIAGRIPELIIGDEYEKAKEAALSYEKLFGKGNFFLELQDHGIPAEKIVISGLLKMSKETGIPLVATNDIHYIEKKDADAREILLCMDRKITAEDPDKPVDEGEYYVKSEEEMQALFSYAPEAIQNTQKIADRINVEIKFHETKMPQYPVPEGYNAWTYLNKICLDGMKKRYADKTKEEYDRLIEMLHYQLGVIKEMGYVEYFLIVWDYCRWARENGVAIGCGRGSAAGSLVTYSTGITDIDPIQFDLQFERFLNPERVSMPDIDVDFDDRRREDVIKHVTKLYGEENVVRIITFQTMAARAVLKDTGKVMGYEYAYCDHLSKMVPAEPGITLLKAMEQSPDFKKEYEGSKETKKLIDMAMRLEGLPKSTGTHAAGVIIGAKPVREYIPLAKTVGGDGVESQFGMNTVEELGLLKMDFLGLRTLTVINDTFRHIKENKGIDVSLDDIDYNDKNVYDFISTGATSGVFQLESKGMQDFMKKLKPACLEDLIAGVSLYRPGPMDFIPAYIKGKENPEKVIYDCPELEPILKKTYGCIVYQEQVTQIVRDLAGYTMGGADNIRRAMSKKKQYVIDENRDIFVNGGTVKVNDEQIEIPGCVKNGISADTANKIYDHMVDFAKYAFNKSHAACYAVISYQTAWLMNYYPTEYWASVLTSFMDNTPIMTPYIPAVRAAGIKLLPPDIKKSIDEFKPMGNEILYAFCGIKGVSQDIAREFVKRREEEGVTITFRDAIKALYECKANSKCIENLIKTGAFDSFGTRKSLLKAYVDILTDAKREAKENITGQMSMFDMPGIIRNDIVVDKEKDYDERKKLDMEYEASGIYISGHPLDHFKAHIDKLSTIKTIDLETDDQGACGVKEDEKIGICCMIAEAKKIFTKKTGEPMSFLVIEDQYGRCDCVIFPKLYEFVSQHIHNGALVYVDGHISIDAEKGASIIADSLTSLSEVPKKLCVKFESREDYEKDKAWIESIKKPGNDQLKIYVVSDDKRICKTESIACTDEVWNRFAEKYGENAKVQI